MGPTVKTMILLIIALSAGFKTITNSPIVKVEGGQIEGTIEDGIAIYKGIPYAAPPVGDLRWRPPQPVIAWKGVLKTDKFGHACPQFKMPVPGYVTSEMGEDCLFLNIWAPAVTGNKKMPVMVWIYGGGFFSGSSSNLLYTGEQIAKKGIVMVSIEYRLGAFGFLAHPELSAESPHHVSGNYGLLDQIAALQWVQRNIKTFGGDPNCVTIFGESAGGQSVSMLAASPLAEGLFHRAICQSGGSFGPAKMVKEDDCMQLLQGAEANGVKFSKRMGANSITELRKTEANKMVGIPGMPDTFYPVIDDYVIKGDQYKLYEAGKYNDVPVLAGFNSDEGSMFASLLAMQGKYKDNIDKRFGPYASKILELYPDGNSNATLRSRANLYRDSYFAWYTYTWANLQSKTGKSKVFVYYLNQKQPNNKALFPGALISDGVPHGGDIPYVFNHMDHDTAIHFTYKHKRLSETILSYWTNFARYGDPNGKETPNWPTYKEDTPTVMYLDDRPHANQFPHLEGVKVMDQYYNWKRSTGN